MRLAEFNRWVAEVRDPAKQNTEGVREIRVKGAAAEYEVAPLPDGRWAVHWCLQYTSGDCSGQALQWTALETRETCLETFRERAVRHFAAEPLLDQQQKARLAMLEKLAGGLFGLIVDVEAVEEAQKRPQSAPKSNGAPSGPENQLVLF